MNGAERARRRLAREVVKQPFQNPMRIRAGYLSKEARKIVGGGFVGGVGDCAHDCERDAVLVADLGDGRALHVNGCNGR